MTRHILMISFAAGLPLGCRTHRLPELPPERDPMAEQAPIVPYSPPPDVLHEELSTGAPEAGGKTGHEGHEMGAKPEPESKAPDEDKAGHEGHDMGVEQDGGAA
jgi:hypothetical protein